MPNYITNIIGYITNNIGDIIIQSCLPILRPSPNRLTLRYSCILSILFDKELPPCSTTPLPACPAKTSPTG